MSDARAEAARSSRSVAPSDARARAIGRDTRCHTRSIFSLDSCVSRTMRSSSRSRSTTTRNGCRRYSARRACPSCRVGARARTLLPPSLGPRRVAAALGPGPHVENARPNDASRRQSTARAPRSAEAGPQCALPLRLRQEAQALLRCSINVKTSRSARKKRTRRRPQKHKDQAERGESNCRHEDFQSP